MCKNTYFQLRNNPLFDYHCLAMVMMWRKNKRKIFPPLWPPSMILRQVGSVFYYGYLVGWYHLPLWLLKSGFKTLPVAAGAYGMGCIGFPAHPVWEVTTACNLRCIHCHASSGKPKPDELNTEEGIRLLDEIASLREFRMLVLTGGEPLVRRDIFELLGYGKQIGLRFVIATNATLLTEEMALRLKSNGVVGLAISLDCANPEEHNFIRNHPQAYELAMRGIRVTKKAGLALQINFTATKYNMEHLEDTINLANNLGADIMLTYQLVCVGRGQDLEEASLRKEENQKLLSLIKNRQRFSSTIIEPVAGPQYWPYLLKGKNVIMSKIANIFFHGCTAGRGLLYIKANGEVWPCPFIEVPSGNVKVRKLSTLWHESEVFQRLRNRKNLKDECRTCHLNEICGGCRGRAWASTGDYLADDPSCFLRDSN